MAVSKISSGVLAIIFALICAVTMVAAQSPAPAPGPASDGNSLDQGIAFAMMMVALLVTYLIH